MKIRVPIIVDVDPQMWADSNGQIVDAAGKFTITDDVREDVRSYVLNAIQQSYEIEVTDATVMLG